LRNSQPQIGHGTATAQPLSISSGYKVDYSICDCDE
jgi:hypothetical protein